MSSDEDFASTEGEDCNLSPELELVFHSHSEDSQAFADAIKRVLQADVKSEIRIVCPYLSSQVVSGIVKNRQFRLVTDINACFEAGADKSLSTFLINTMANVRHLPKVHAKVVSTDKAALIGSANLTKSGFSERDELGCIIRNSELLKALDDWFEGLWQRSVLVKKADIEACLQYQPKLHKPPKLISRAPKYDCRPKRSLGWLSNVVKQTSIRSETSIHSATHQIYCLEKERNELVAQLKKLTQSREEADDVLYFLAEALKIVALPIEDKRLHLNFGGNSPISVTVNQRNVAWCSKRKGTVFFNFILDSKDVAQKATEHLQGVKLSSFRNNKVDERPILRVPLAELSHLTPDIHESWQRAIRLEVERKCSDGKYPISSYRKYLRPYLFDVLSDKCLRQEIVWSLFPAYWWFGVNNSSIGHVQLDSIQPFLSGAEQTFSWPFGNSKPRKLYKDMNAGDHVLIWTGRGRNTNWGVIGTAKIAEVFTEKLVLEKGEFFLRPITPYPKNNPHETKEVQFLKETLGPDFIPFGDVMRVVYGTRRTPPRTVDALTETAFKSIISFQKGHTATPS